ncbi:MAG: serine hydrolase [Streptosporangiales bacterium]
MDVIEAELDAVCDGLPFEVRWCLRDLRSGQTWDRLGSVSGWSASTRKVSVLMAALSLASRGVLDLDQPVTYTAELKEGVRSGTFRYMTPGFSFPLRDALGQMMVTSDNVCTALVFGALGGSPEESVQAVNDYCQSIGLRDTVHRHIFPDTSLIPWYHSNEVMTTTTAADQARLLSRIVDGAREPRSAAELACSAELCAYALTLMSREHDEQMTRLLPARTHGATKGGRGIRGRSHVGVIYADGTPRFALAVFTDWVPVTLLDGTPGTVHALSAISTLARRAWDVLADA